MKLTIFSKRLGREVTFSRPGSDYLYVDLNGQPGCLGKQLCDGGYLSGSTVGYGGDSEEEFAGVCRQWWRNYLRNHPAAPEMDAELSAEMEKFQREYEDSL